MDEDSRNAESQNREVVTGRTMIDVIFYSFNLLRRQDIFIPIKVGVLALCFALSIGVVREHRITEPGKKVVFVGLDLWTKKPAWAAETVDVNFSAIEVEVYSRTIDSELVLEALHSENFNISEMQPSKRVSSNRPTNTIWYGPDVPPGAVELVTEILIEKGLDIVEVKPFSIADGKEAKIQVGSQEYVK